MNQTVALIYSGGLDSTVLLTELIGQGVSVFCVHFNYGSVHNVSEGRAASYFAKKYGCELVKVKLHLKNMLNSGLLNNDIPSGHYAEESMKKTIVPFRNGIMLSIAAGIVNSRGINKLYIANHAGDHYIYPDCRPDFIAGIAKAIYYGTEPNVVIQSPYIAITKTELVKKGEKLGVQFEKTWSCYRGGKIHCGTCGTCTERLISFREANVPDKTKYLDKEAALQYES